MAAADSTLHRRALSRLVSSRLLQLKLIPSPFAPCGGGGTLTRMESERRAAALARVSMSEFRTRSSSLRPCILDKAVFCLWFKKYNARGARAHSCFLTKHNTSPAGSLAAALRWCQKRSVPLAKWSGWTWLGTRPRLGSARLGSSALQRARPGRPAASSFRSLAPRPRHHPITRARRGPPRHFSSRRRPPKFGPWRDAWRHEPSRWSRGGSRPSG